MSGRGFYLKQNIMANISIEKDELIEIEFIGSKIRGYFYFDQQAGLFFLSEETHEKVYNINNSINAYYSLGYLKEFKSKYPFIASKIIYATYVSSLTSSNFFRSDSTPDYRRISRNLSESNSKALFDVSRLKPGDYIKGTISNIKNSNVLLYKGPYEGILFRSNDTNIYFLSNNIEINGNNVGDVIKQKFGYNYSYQLTTNHVNYKYEFQSNPSEVIKNYWEVSKEKVEYVKCINNGAYGSSIITKDKIYKLLSDNRFVLNDGNTSHSPYYVYSSLCWEISTKEEYDKQESSNILNGYIKLDPHILKDGEYIEVYIKSSPSTKYYPKDCKVILLKEKEMLYLISNFESLNGSNRLSINTKEKFGCDYNYSITLDTWEFLRAESDSIKTYKEEKRIVVNSNKPYPDFYDHNSCVEMVTENRDIEKKDNYYQNPVIIKNNKRKNKLIISK